MTIMLLYCAATTCDTLNIDTLKVEKVQSPSIQTKNSPNITNSPRIN